MSDEIPEGGGQDLDSEQVATRVGVSPEDSRLMCSETGVGDI
jgi:hypothetical protein